MACVSSRSTHSCTYKAYSNYVRVGFGKGELHTKHTIQASAYLILCIIVSLEGDRLIWKSSNVAPLFHGLEGWPESSLLEERVEEMEKAAEGMYVKSDRDRLGRLALVRR
jgi:hypothetical protein